MLPPSDLANLYWRIRNARALERRYIRTWYRRIEDEKKRLIESGVNGELVRLYCRYLANPDNRHARAAFDNFSIQLELDFAPPG
jgi:hypothetical protein